MAFRRVSVAPFTNRSISATIGSISGRVRREVGVATPNARMSSR